MRQMPFFLVTTPRGKHRRLGIGGDRKGSAVWLLRMIDDKNSQLTRGKLLQITMQYVHAM